MGTMDYSRFERKLAMHTAPSLLGIKCASLVSISREELDIDGCVGRFNEKVAVKGLKAERLCQCGSRILLLVYRADMLERRLCEPCSREVLRSCGYTDDMGLRECLIRLSHRIESGGDFPHEIGIFLDYPTDDVVEFIRNNGCNYKLCGYWKVYGN